MFSGELLNRCVDVREITFRSRDPRKPGENFLLNAIGKINVRFVFTEIFKRQDRNRFAQRPRWPRLLSRAFFYFELFRRLWIAGVIRVEINDSERCAVFYFANSQIVQERPPAPILFEIVGDAFGQQNVSGIATIHYALGDVDTGAGDVGLFI